MRRICVRNIATRTYADCKKQIICITSKVFRRVVELRYELFFFSLWLRFDLLPYSYNLIELELKCMSLKRGG